MIAAWKLFVANPGQDWQVIDVVDDLAGAAARIRQIEGYPVSGLHLEFYIDPLTSGAEALSHFEHAGLINHYVILRVVQ